MGLETRFEHALGSKEKKSQAWELQEAGSIVEVTGGVMSAIQQLELYTQRKIPKNPPSPKKKVPNNQKIKRNHQKE